MKGLKGSGLEALKIVHEVTESMHFIKEFKILRVVQVLSCLCWEVISKLKVGM